MPKRTFIVRQVTLASRDESRHRIGATESRSENVFARPYGRRRIATPYERRAGFPGPRRHLLAISLRRIPRASSLHRCPVTGGYCGDALRVTVAGRPRTARHRPPLRRHPFCSRGRPAAAGAPDVPPAQSWPCRPPSLSHGAAPLCMSLLLGNISPSRKFRPLSRERS